MFGLPPRAGTPRERALALARATRERAATLAQLERERSARPSPTPPHLPLHTPALSQAIHSRGDCAECGEQHALRRDGRVWAHRQERVGRHGRYRSADRCPGSGQPPERGLFQHNHPGV